MPWWSRWARQRATTVSMLPITKYGEASSWSLASLPPATTSPDNDRFNTRHHLLETSILVDDVVHVKSSPLR
jgi:hypothetical protein